MKVKIFANLKKPAVRKALPGLKKILCKNLARPGDGKFDAAFALGGDGWLLKTLSLLSAEKTDIYFFPMGENTFTRGFKISDASKIISGMMKTERYRPPYLKTFTRAFNEIVIKTGKIARCVKYEVTAGRKKFASEGDGIIVATPLGSTAYSAAAGGETLPLGSGKAVITPMISFTGRKKSMLTSLKNRIKIKILEKQGDLWESADGRETAPAGKTTVITSGKAACRIVFPAGGTAKRRKK